VLPFDSLHVALTCSRCWRTDNRHEVRTRWSSPALKPVERAPRASGVAYQLGAAVPGLEAERSRFHAVSRRGCGARFCWWVATEAGRVQAVEPVESLDGRCDACRRASK